MRTKQLFLILALLCTMVQGAWAQASWDEVYAMTNTTSANWTALPEGTTAGATIGMAGATTYYYASKHIYYGNHTPGGSALTILGTVYIYMPYSFSVTCTGANASGQTGAGAGIELTSGNSLFLLGQGEVSATGGNAANGGDGTNGSDAGWDNSNYWSGTGGAGGYGGGGAGAGIGTRGGQGGNGGAGAASVVSAYSTAGGGSGSAGQAGATAGAMGELYVAQSFGNLTATGGVAASQSGSAGGAGKGALYDGASNYSAAGGGGGGGGGFGGAATGIGTGGPGGGGGGGGASSNLDWASSGYYVVKAPGGKGGQNADGTWAAAGAEGIMNHNGLKNGQVVTNGSGWGDEQYNYDSYVSTQAVGTGGSGGAIGAASTSEQYITVNMKLPTQDEWDMACQQTNTSQSQWKVLPPGNRRGTTIGTAGSTTYYIATGDRTFTNSNVGGSGLTILGMVYLCVPEAVTLTCTGAHASGATGGGAGIELTQGNVLTLLGGGTVIATGGNAANGSDGLDGGDAGWNNDNFWSGPSGAGGDGGGGAGAGIGTRGGDAGSGGAGAASVVVGWNFVYHSGGSGADGEAGETAGAMGILYNSEPYVHLTATGGAAATAGGSPGRAGKSYLYEGSCDYSAAGGGGGGGGGFGGAAANIGSGGPGGGGGGGGASGNIDILDPAYTGYLVVRAPGGKGGQNVDGTWNAEGAESILNYQAITNGQVNSNKSSWGNTDSNVSKQAVGSGGNGGAAGQACTSGQVVNVTVKLPEQSEWDMVCQQTKTSRSQWSLLPHGNIMGTTLGTAGSDSYYYATGDRTFANANAGGSGLTILGTVHLFIASGQTITCTGADASGATGGGAGVELTEGNTLCLIGSGKIVATGGNAANGGNGSKGGDALYKVAKSAFDNNGLKSGDGGRGGDGGGGAGAGIGTRGADGGAGGAGGVGKQGKEEVTGDVGSNGVGGDTAADMGTLYVYQMAKPTMEIHGGSSGSSGGNGGAAGLNAVFRPLATAGFIYMFLAPKKNSHDGSSGTSRRSGAVMGDIYSVGGGGGGGAGGFGGAASDIGSGGPGGGGGGGGASGSVTYVYTITSGLSYYQVGALGGKGGANVDGTAAADGEGTLINSDKTNVVFEKDDYKDYTLLGWYNGLDIRAAGGEGANPGAAAQSGTYDVIPAVITLADDADNSTTISDAHGYLADVTLQDRTLYKDGAWNTICLPFDVTLAGSPLAGAEARSLSEASISGTTLNLTFGDAVTTLKAGRPYIIKWACGDNIVSPVFSGVTIDKTDRSYDNGISGDNRVRFLGTYSSTAFTAADNSILLLGGENKLYYPTAGAGIGAQRAYFKIGSDGALLARRLTAFNIDFGDDEATGIISTTNYTNDTNSDAWFSDQQSECGVAFTLDGRKLSGKPSVKGVYVNNGRKVIIK